MKLLELGLNREARSNPLESPAVPLGSPVGWHWLEGSRGSDAAEVVNPHTSMAQATVNGCVTLLANAVASMTPILYEKTDNGKVEAQSHPLHRLLSLEPNPESSAFTMWSSFMASILLWGNGYIEIQRDGVGNVLGLWFRRPETITPLRQSDGSLVYRCTEGLPAGHFRTLSPRQVVHIPAGFSVDGVSGISVIAQARNAIGGSIALDKFGNRFFANYAMPQLALLTKGQIKPEVKSQMRQDWELLQRGANQHRVAVLDQDTDIKTLSIPNADAQWIESRKLSREEICGLFALKPSQIGSEARVSGETYSQQSLDFLVTTVNPWLARIRQELTRKLLAGLQYEIRHDVSDRLRLDVKSMMDAFSVARSFSIMTSNECRKELGLNPGGPECDVFWRPVNMVDARQTGQPDPTPKEGADNV